MQVTKVDIVQKTMRIPDDQPYMEFAKPLGELYPIFTEGDDMANRVMRFEKERYEVVKLYYPDTRKPKLYLVKVEDKGVFKELETVFQSNVQRRIDREVAERVGYVQEAAYNRGLADGKDFVRTRVSWVRRLFNRF